LTSLEEDFDVALRRIVEKYDKHSMRSYIQEYKREWNGAAIDYLESMQTASGLYDRSFVAMLLDYFDFQTSHPTHPTPKAKHSVCCVARTANFFCVARSNRRRNPRAS